MGQLVPLSKVCRRQVSGTRKKKRRTYQEREEEDRGAVVRADLLETMTRPELVTQYGARRKQRHQLGQVDPVSRLPRRLPFKHLGRDPLRGPERAIEPLRVRDAEDDGRDPGDQDDDDGDRDRDAGAERALAVVGAVLADVPTGDRGPDLEKGAAPDRAEPSDPQAGVVARQAGSFRDLDRRVDQPKSNCQEQRRCQMQVLPARQREVWQKQRKVAKEERQVAKGLRPA